MTAKKMRILIGVLVALLAVSGIGYFLVDRSKRQQEAAEAQENASLTLFSFSADDVTEIDILNDEGHFHLSALTTGWKLTETDYPYDFILNTYYVNVVSSYMSGLTAMTKFDAGDDLSVYGLDDPVTVSCTEGNSTHTLYIGTESATREYYYVMVPDDGTVYCIDHDYGAVLHGGTAYLKSPYMINYFDVDVNDIALVRRGETIFDLAWDNGAWNMKAPLEDANTDAVQISSMLTTLTRIELETFVTMADSSTDLSAYGLDDPGYTLTVTNVDGSTTTIDYADYDPNDGSLYLIYRETGQIATLSTARAGFLSTDTIELLNKKIMPLTFDEVSRIEATVDDISFTMENDQDTYRFNGTDVKALSGSGASTFRLLFDSIVGITFDTLQPDDEPDTEAEATVTFRFTMTDGTEHELSLVPIDDTSYDAFTDGSYSHMTVRRNALSGSTGVLNYYESIADLIAESQ